MIDLSLPLSPEAAPPPAEDSGSRGSAYTRDGEIDTQEVPLCPVCGHTEHRTDATGRDYELNTCRNVWRMVRCERCDHVWLNPRPALESIPVIYPPHYYAYNYETQINPVAVAAKSWMDRRKLRGILRGAGRADPAYLDVGCGNGRMLRAAEEHGIPRSRLTGLELDERVVARLRDEGYSAFAERVEDCESIPPRSIDVATMFHVIEHVDDPASVLRKLAAWIVPGGVLAVETPNLDSLDRRLFRRSYWGGYHFPRHWNLYTAVTLTRQLRDAGFEPFLTSYQTGHAFWMYSIHHWCLYQGRPWPRIARMFDPFRGLPFLAAFTAWDKLRAALGFKTSAVLMLARRVNA